MTGLIVYLIDAIMAATQIGLVALGFAVVFRITGHLHFAYAGIWTLVSYLFGSLLDTGLSFGAAFVCSALVAAVLSLGCLVVYHRLRGEYSLILTSFGIYLALLGVQLLAWGPSQTGIAADSGFSGVWQFSLFGSRIIVPVVAAAQTAAMIAAVAMVAFLLGGTKLGMQATAVASNRFLAIATGIRVAWIELAAYVLSGILLTVSVAIQVAAVGSDAFTGTTLFFEAIIVVILAGKVIVGTALASLMFGAIVAAVQMVLGTEWVTLGTYSILLLLISWKPAGFLVRDLIWHRRTVTWPEDGGASVEARAEAR